MKVEIVVVFLGGGVAIVGGRLQLEKKRMGCGRFARDGSA